jgi:hypothetical protein
MSLSLSVVPFDGLPVATDMRFIPDLAPLRDVTNPTAAGAPRGLKKS